MADRFVIAATVDRLIYDNDTTFSADDARLLLDSLPADTIRWGHKVSGVRPLGEGRHEEGEAPRSSTVTSGASKGKGHTAAGVG